MRVAFAGQVRERDLLDVDDPHAAALGAGGDRLRRSPPPWPRRAPRRAVSSSSETTRSTSPPTWAIAAPIAFATAKCSGLTSSRAPGSARRAGRAAADDDDRDRVGARLHPVDGLGDPLLDLRSAALDEPTVEPGDALAVAELRAPGGDGEVAGGQRRRRRTRAPAASARSRRCRGPTSARRRRRTRLPPPSPSESTSGMRKFVRTPPISTATAASRGKPCCEHADVRRSCRRCRPPRSRRAPERNAAPRIEFVGPDAKVATG